MAQEANLSLGILRGEDCIAGDERICSRTPDFPDCIATYPSIDFECGTAPHLIEELARTHDLLERCWDEFLSAESRIDCHHEQEVDIGESLAHRDQRGRRI